MQGVGDVNGDNQADLLWRNITSGAVVVWLTNGATFGLGSMPLEWQVAGLGDVSGDGQVDVIWRNSENGEVVVWKMNGLRINTMDLPEHISTDWAFQGVGDVDGNGQADIFWRNSTSGVVTLWLMNGATIESFGFLGPPTDWEIVQVGDVDGDGNADVIWRNSVNGEVSVWVMNGPVLAENAVIATSVPLDWMIQRGGDNSPPLFGLNFSPYLDGQDQNLEAQISESQIRERLAVIRPYAKWVRTFGCGDGLEKIGRIAHQLGLKAAIGGKLGRDLTANQQQIECLINTAKAREADLVIVGSEALLHGDLTGAELVNLINQVKQEVPENIPVAYADVYSELLSYPDVVEAMDVVLVNYYPYLEGIKVDLGMPSIHGYHQQIIAAAKGKPIVVSETGWPSEGDTVGEAIPSVENACYYFQNFISWAEANAVDSFNFSAFDESGNGVPEGSQGAYWDIWDIWDINRDETGTLKPCIQETLEGKRMGDNWSGMDLSDE